MDADLSEHNSDQAGLVEHGPWRLKDDPENKTAELAIFLPMPQADACRTNFQKSPSHKFTFYPIEVKLLQHKIVTQNNIDALALANVNKFLRQRRLAGACAPNKLNMHFEYPLIQPMVALTLRFGFILFLVLDKQPGRNPSPCTPTSYAS